MDRLIEAADEALSRGNALLCQAKVEAVPELGSSTGSVLLEGQQATEALNDYLGSLEHILRELCGPYDFRTLLLFSRMCSGLEHFRKTEAHLGQAAMLRCQTADYAALMFGNRDLSDQFVWDEQGNTGFGGFSGSIAEDVVCLHVLATQYRQILTALLMFNFLRKL